MHRSHLCVCFSCSKYVSLVGCLDFFFFFLSQSKRLFNTEDVQSKRDILYTWIFVCCKCWCSRFWYFRQASWTPVILFINQSSLKERCFLVFIILAYPVYSLFTFVLVACYVTTLLNTGNGHLKYMMYYHIRGLKKCVITALFSFTWFLCSTTQSKLKLKLVPS